MNIKKLLLLMFAFSYMLCNAQERGFGIGLEVNSHKEPRFKEYSFPISLVKKTNHYDYLLSLTYTLNNKSLIGLTLGGGEGNSSQYSEGRKQNENFKSISSEIGLFYKYKFLRYKQINVFAQPVLRCRTLSYQTYLHYDVPISCDTTTSSIAFVSIGLQMKLGVEYNVTKRLSICGFVANDIVSKDIGVVESGVVRRSENLVFLRDYLVMGLGVCWRFF